MENAVVYARYSSHNQTEQSIEGQLSAARKYALANGYNIIHEYCDRAKTGTNDRRDEFQKMLKDSAKGKFTVVIVWKVDRFGRNREEIIFNKVILRKNKVRVEYVAENLSDGPESVIMEALFEGMAEYYSKQLSQNIERGKLESAKKHKAVNGHCALGYTIDDNKQYVIDDGQAQLVREIFERYSQGYTMAEITAYLNSRGYKTSKGNEFNKNSLSRILSNVMYIGVYKYKDIIYDEDAVPAIIDKELFYKVQDQMKTNQKTPQRKWTYSEYLLSGKLCCGECGSNMVGVAGTSKTGKKHNYYACSSYRKHECSKSPIRQDVLEEIICRKINCVLKDYRLVNRIADATWQYWQDQDQSRRNMENLKKQIAQTDIAISNLVKAIEKGENLDLLNQRIKERKEEKILLEKDLAYESKVSKIFSKESILLFLNKFVDGDINDRNVQKRLINTFVNKIYLFDEKISIVLNYSDSATNTITIDDLTSISDKGVRLCCTDWSIRNGIRTLSLVNGMLYLEILLI